MLRFTFTALSFVTLFTPLQASAYCMVKNNDPDGIAVLSVGSSHGTETHRMMCLDADDDTDMLIDQCGAAGSEHFETVVSGRNPCDPTAASPPSWCVGSPFAFDLWVGTDDNDTKDFTDSIVPIAYYGGGGVDTITGSVYGDWLHGGAGRDWLNGGRGDDQICPGTCGSACAQERQITYGGPGRDIILGSSDPDEIFGGKGNDIIQGAAADDVLWGGPGDDVVHGGVGSDHLYGGIGSDQLHGAAGSDFFYGGTYGADDGERDILLAVDEDTDAVIDADEQDVCYLDNDEGADPIPTDSGDCGGGLELFAPACENDRLYAGQDDLLYVIDVLDGAELATLPVTLSTGDSVERFDGLAVHPSNCDLWGVVTNASTGEQALARMTCDDTSCIATDTSVLDGSTRPIVDLAFNQQGEMFLLTETADLLQLNSTTKRLDTILVGEEWAPGNLAVHMAYDDPDGGFIFISTLDESQEYVVHLVSARASTAGAAFAAVTREPNTYYEGGALTVHALDEHPGGKFYEIRPDGGLWGHQRKHFLVKPVLDVDGAQVFAPLGDPQSLTISHW